MRTVPFRFKMCTDQRGDFSRVRDSKVLIYFPHGFGDWVQFSYVLPLLEPSNKYYITRFGDDFVSIFDGSEFVEPVYLGVNVNVSSHGENYGVKHFGLDIDNAKPGKVEAQLPASLFKLCSEQNIRTMLFTGFPEPCGFVDPPYNSKARNIISHLLAPERLERIDMSNPLRSAIDFRVPAVVQNWVESRLRNLIGFRPKRLCLIGRSGYTSIGKNWGHEWRDENPDKVLPEGHECREFMRLLLRRDPNWVFLTLEDRFHDAFNTVRSIENNCYSYAELFGTANSPLLPFALVMKSLVNLADLSVGVPAGPQHLAMAKPGLRCISLWMQHFPSWFDEPKERSRHLLSQNVKEIGIADRGGSFESFGGLSYSLRYSDTKNIPAEMVVDAAMELMS